MKKYFAITVAILILGMEAAASAQVTFLADTFNDTNGTLLKNHTSDSGSTWADAGGTYNHDITIYNSGGGIHDTYMANGAGLAMNVASTAGPGPNLTATLTLNWYTSAGTSHGVLLRADSTAVSGYLVAYTHSGTQQFVIYRESSSSFTSLATQNYAWTGSSPLTYTATISGTNPTVITVYIGGVQQLTYSDSSPINTTSTHIGLWASDGSGITTSTGVHAASITAGVMGLTANASFSSITTTTVNLSVSASGGISPYTYQWYRSSTAAFMPGAGNLLSGATSTTLADAPGSAGPWFYQCVVTDSTTPSAQTATSNQVAGTLYATPISILCIGDSITHGQGLSAGQDPCTQMGLQLDWIYKLPVQTVTTNQGINGTATSSWWSGGAATSNLTGAVTAGAAATPAATIAHIMFGANDAASSFRTTAANYASNLQSIANYLLTHGYTKVIISHPTYIPAGANSGATDLTATGLAYQYLAAVNSIANGSTILVGDSQAYQLWPNVQSTYLQSDNTHPNATGAQVLGSLWASAVASDLGWVPVAGFWYGN
jgi:lysophospholipase L1-like esterase